MLMYIISITFNDGFMHNSSNYIFYNIVLQVFCMKPTKCLIGMFKTFIFNPKPFTYKDFLKRKIFSPAVNFVLGNIEITFTG